MSVANRITLGRLGLAFVLFVLLAFLDVGSPRAGIWLTACFLLFITVVATDALDGYYARKLGQVSDFGRIADPAVDKVVVAGTMIFLASMPWAQEVLPPWMVVLVVAREFTISGLRAFVESQGINFGADFTGKLKMIAQSVAIPAVFFFEMIECFVPGVAWATTSTRWLAIGLVWIMTLLTVWSGAEYLLKARRLLARKV